MRKGREQGRKNRWRAALNECPWRQEEIIKKMRQDAHDGSTLNLAFGKCAWCPGSGYRFDGKWLKHISSKK